MRIRIQSCKLKMSQGLQQGEPYIASAQQHHSSWALDAYKAHLMSTRDVAVLTSTLKVRPQGSGWMLQAVMTLMGSRARPIRGPAVLEKCMKL